MDALKMIVILGIICGCLAIYSLVLSYRVKKLVRQKLCPDGVPTVDYILSVVARGAAIRETGGTEFYARYVRILNDADLTILATYETQLENFLNDPHEWLIQ